MGRCHFCKKKCGIPMECKQCMIELCTSCYMPERHKCMNLKTFIENKKELHIKNLQQSKCVQSKMEKI